MTITEQLESALSEGVGGLIADGWEPQPWKPGEPTTYTKGGRKLFKKGTSWYLDGDKLGKLSDKKLVAKIKSL